MSAALSAPIASAACARLLCAQPSRLTGSLTHRAARSASPRHVLGNLRLPSFRQCARLVACSALSVLDLRFKRRAAPRLTSRILSRFAPRLAPHRAAPRRTAPRLVAPRVSRRALRLVAPSLGASPHLASSHRNSRSPCKMFGEARQTSTAPSCSPRHVLPRARLRLATCSATFGSLRFGGLRSPPPRSTLAPRRAAPRHTARQLRLRPHTVLSLLWPYLSCYLNYATRLGYNLPLQFHTNLVEKSTNILTVNRFAALRRHPHRFQVQTSAGRSQLAYETASYYESSSRNGISHDLLPSLRRLALASSALAPRRAAPRRTARQLRLRPRT